MRKNPLLKDVVDSLNDLYLEFQDENVVAVSYDKGDFPFLFLIIQKEVPDTIFLSISTEHIDNNALAQFVIDLMHFAKIEVGDSFTFTETGELIIGDHTSSNEVLDLINAKPVNDYKN